MDFESRIPSAVDNNIQVVSSNSCFLFSPNCLIQCKVIGKRVNRGGGFGREIPMNNDFKGTQKPSIGAKVRPKNCIIGG